MITLGGGWKLNNDTRWVLVDESGRSVVSVISRDELYVYLQKFGVPLTPEAIEALADLPEHHPAYRKAR